MTTLKQQTDSTLVSARDLSPGNEQHADRKEITSPTLQVTFPTDIETNTDPVRSDTTSGIRVRIENKQDLERFISSCG